MTPAKMIIVGGFLGAGKTTLLARAAELLARRGVRVGLITNDQAANLVDTEILQQAGRPVKEVAGACFCCAFNRLLYVCEQLIQSFQPEVIVGEPVGSCTDLSATVLQPMKKLCRDTLDLAPYTVLVDPAAFEAHVGPAAGRPESIRYIYRKQLEEADLLVLNKIDTLPAARAEEILSAIRKEFPGIPLTTMSVTQGFGVEKWLDTILAGGKAGQRIAEVDYDTYAEGEAALGWLNAAVRLGAPGPIHWKAFGTDLLERIGTRLTAAAADIAHVKILLSADDQKLKLSLTANAAQPSLEGGIAGSNRALMVVNARVRTDPDELKAVVERCIQDAARNQIAAEVVEITSFRPGRPNPVHRFKSVV